MDQATRTAVLDSIRHWRENAEATRPSAASIGADKCALCVKFSYKLYGPAACKECPVYKKTGLAGCGGTPYHEAKGVLTTWKDLARLEGKVSADMEDFLARKIAEAKAKQGFQDAAAKEVRFLESLLLEEK